MNIDRVNIISWEVSQRKEKVGAVGELFAEAMEFIHCNII